MPRRPRERAESGYYHVVLKGSGNQILFECEEDHRSFLFYIDEYIARHDIRLIAWCLMSNHVHLILFDISDRLPDFMHDLATSYAVRFNKTAGHIGPVFDGRYHSVRIATDEQLLCALRYVHDNPAKAGVCPAAQYPWSSYGDYLNGDSTRTYLAPVLDLIGGQGNFKAFSEASEYGGYVFKPGRRVTDDEALELAQSILGADRIPKLKSEKKMERNQALQALRSEGLTVKQIERITGIGRSIISRTTRI
ncbi:MAG: transposase [Coriobacteriaceae bacterium]|nr:transposase [Coriobacteriaceae bacterium]